MRKKQVGSHEFQDRETIIKSSSDRSFGFVFAAFFAIVAGASVYFGGERWPIWTGLSLAFGITALVAPSVLAPLNRLWTKLGLLLSTVISPIVLGLIFYTCITPIGLLLRLTGKDLLRLRIEPDTKSYWIVRDPPGPPGDSLDKQF